MKYCSGMIRRRSSQIRSTTYVAVISSTRPHSPSTISTSSSRIGCVKASCNPAIILLNTVLPARPATSPTTPAEASRLAPTCRAPGNVISNIAAPITTTNAIAMRESTRVWVWMRRAFMLSSTSTGCRSSTPCAKPAMTRATSHVMAAINSRPLTCRTLSIQRSSSGAACQTVCNASSSRTAFDGTRTLTTMGWSIWAERVIRSSSRLPMRCASSTTTTATKAAVHVPNQG